VRTIWNSEEVDGMTFKDHFSGHAPDYSSFRPTYPDALYEYLASLVSAHDLAWDCATGNGQAALGLASSSFHMVIATDASRPQLGQARLHERVAYVVASAERPPLPDASVDLVTVAQAVHWFNLDGFYAEVRRVMKPGGILAVWCYHLQTVSPGVDAAFGRLYAEVLGRYRPPEWRLTESGYAELEFPFTGVTPPRFQMVRRWSLDRLLDYVRTWSACRHYLLEEGSDPTDEIRVELEAAWGDPGQEREVVWPLHLKVGRIG
jgi:SAM-dependent methyltransferase